MHTEPDSTAPTRRDLEQTMTRVQIAALETLERLMKDPPAIDNESLARLHSTERNRQRLAATQALIHCRTMQRERRERREQSHRIRLDEREAARRAPRELAALRRLHMHYPGEYDNPDGERKTAAPGAACATQLEPASRIDPLPAKTVPTEIGTALAAQLIALAGKTKGRSGP